MTIMEYLSHQVLLKDGLKNIKVLLQRKMSLKNILGLNYKI